MTPATLKLKMRNYIHELMIDFGFKGLSDFMDSAFHVSHGKMIMLLSVTGGTLASMFEEFIGLEPIVYISLAMLITLEFVTGVMASLKSGAKIESKRFGRFIFKIGSYTAIIGLVNIFKTHLDMPTVVGLDIDIYGWIYFVALNMVIVQLIISVFENFAKLGFSESSWIFKFINQKAKKWFKLDEE